MPIKRGEIYWAALDPVRGSEQAGHRPVVVLQNNVGNEFSPTTIVAPVTTKKFHKEYPTNVYLPKSSGLKEDSTVLLSQIRTVDKSRLGKKVASLTPFYLDQVDEAIRNSLGVRAAP